MNIEAHGLFRPEVVERRARRLQGEISLAVPLGWQLIGYSLLAALVVAIAFLTIATHARTQVVPGTITLDTGIVPVVPTRSGRIVRMAASEGQLVKAGQELAVLATEESLASGSMAPSGSLSAAHAQNALLSDQVARIRGAAGADRARLAARVASLAAELDGLGGQIRSQEQLLRLAEADFNQVRSLSGQGFISRRDIDSRETTFITRQQQLAQLRQARSAKLGEIEEGRRAMEQVAETAAAQAAAVLASRAQLDRSVEELEQRAGYRLVAPVAGTVTSVTGRVGQVGASDAPIMVILPAGALFTAELEVPSASAGFLEVGQEVRLAVDAYPHQQFGLVEGRVEQLPRSVVTRPSADGGMKTFYPVIVTIPRPYISAFGARHELRPGMTLTARIVTRRQSLLESLFEPVLTAVRR